MTLKTLQIPGKEAMDVRLLLFKRIEPIVNGDLITN